MSQTFWLQYAKRHTPQKYFHMECTQNDCYYHMECIFLKKKGEVTLTKPHSGLKSLLKAHIETPTRKNK